MSKEQVKAVFDRVLAWPSERQDDAATILMLMESQDESVYRLTDEQVRLLVTATTDRRPARSEFASPHPARR